MNRIIFAAAVLLMLTGCSTPRRTAIEPVVLRESDSVRVETVEKVRLDTVRVTVWLPQESVKQTVNDSVSHLETELAESDAWINDDGTLGHSLKNKEGTLTVDVVVAGKERETRETRTGVKEVPVPYPEPVYIERELTRWEAFRLKAFWWLAAGWIGAAALAGWWIRQKMRR